MRIVILIFPDTLMMSDFIMQCRISNAEVNSRDLTLTAVLSEKQIEVACAKYQAFLRNNKEFQGY